MCDKCQQLENDIQRYRKHLEQSLDTRTIEIQRARKLLAVGLDPLTVRCIDGVIQELVQPKPVQARSPKRSRLGTTNGFLEDRQPPPRVIH
jgi:hypothetical protein